MPPETAMRACIGRCIEAVPRSKAGQDAAKDTPALAAPRVRRLEADEMLTAVMDHSRGRFLELDLDFAPAPSGGGIYLFQLEDNRNSYAVVHGYTPQRPEGAARADGHRPRHHHRARPEHLRLPQRRGFTGQTTDWMHGEHSSNWVQSEALRRLG